MKMRLLRKAIPLFTAITFLLLGNTGRVSAQIINTICGTGTGSYSGDSGPAMSATINQDVTVAVDGAGNLYIGDYANNRIRKITLATGLISTVAGTGTAGYSGDGSAATSAQINGPSGVWADNAGNVYIADVNNHRVRMVNTSGIISTIAGTGSLGYTGDGGPATSATLNYPGRVYMDGSGNIYISDRYNYCIRKINPSGTISTFAGSGSAGFSGDGGAATSAQINVPFCVESDASGNVYIADLYNNRVRVVNSSGIINTFAGTGSSTFSGDGGAATSAGVHGPEGLCYDAAGNLYIGDNTASSLGDDRIRVVNTSNIINTFAGTGSTGFSGDGGPATAATFNIPGGLARHRNAIFVADQFNNRVRRIGLTNGAPAYQSGATAVLNICQNASATSIVTQLTVVDSEEFQPEVWSLLTSPAHGSTGGFPFTWLSNGGAVMPTGQTYTPATGYIGRDSFLVTVFDGVDYDTIRVNVNITAIPSAGTITGPTTVCAGSTITLTDTTSGGTWSSGSPSLASVSTAGVVYGVAVGSPIISYTYTNSCGTGYATYPITVVTYPVSGTISGPSAVCVGQVISLSTTGTSGTWSASNANATVSGSGSVSGAIAGTDTIMYSVTNACGTATDRHIVTVNPLPAAITGTTSLCDGGNTVVLNETTTGGTWSTSASGIASVNGTGTVTSTGVGTANISYTITATGCYVSIPVTVNPLPAAITGGTSICLGTSISLTETTPGGTWASSNTAIASVYGPGTVYGVSIGGATITYALTATGCYVTHAVNVTGVPPAITGGSFVCVGRTNVMSNTVAGGAWSTSDATIASIDGSGNLYGVAVGSATISYTSGSCFSTLAITVGSSPAAITGPSMVCMGDSITLASTSTGGAWSSSATTVATIGGSSGVVTGASVGTTTITYSFTTSSGCYTTTNITVNPIPSAITGIDSVCEAGGLTSLFDASSGGIWSSSNPSLASVTSTGGVVTGVSRGTVTISYTVSGCAARMVMNVLQLPGGYIRALSDTMLCPGGTVSLLAGTLTGATYQWYSAGSPISGATSAFYTATTPSNYRVAVTSTFGCTSTSAPVSVTLNPATATATAAGPTSFCSGGSVLLSANTGAGLTYQWLNGGAAITGATGSTYRATTSGIYGVLVTNSTGCSATSATITVTVTTMPTSGVTVSGSLTICNGDSLLLTADYTAGATYQWQSGTSDITGETSRSYIPTGTGTYRVVITNGSCIATSTTRSVTINPLPVATISAAGATSFCLGSSVRLAGIYSAGNTYQWYNGTSAIAGATDTAYTATATGNYSLRVINSFGCRQIGSSIVVVVNGRPSAANITGADSVCLGDTAIFRASSPGGIWSVATGVTSINGSGRAIGMRLGTDTVRYTLSNTCGTAVSERTIRVIYCATGVAETAAEAGSIAVFPNPTTGEIRIASPITIQSVTVTNAIGQTVATQTPSALQTVIDLSALPSGVYLVRINGTYVVRVVRE